MSSSSSSLPVLYFGVSLWVTHGRGPMDSDSVAQAITAVVLQGVLPAFGMFALYRMWLGIVELRPHWFYKRESVDIPEPYRHVEPTYRHRWDEKKENGMPVVDLGVDGGWRNILAAVFYLFIAQGLPWLFR